MFERRAQWTSILFLVLVVVLMTAGCFGGDDSTTKTTRTVTTGASGGGAGPEEGVVLRGADDEPAEFVDALENRPIVVLFYIAGNADDIKVLDTVNRLRTSFDSYVFLLYDYKDSDAYGSLAQELEVDYTPFLALVDASAVLQKRFVGFVDEGTLNQSLVNLGR